jgi:hypothetical protein
MNDTAVPTLFDVTNGAWGVADEEEPAFIFMQKFLELIILFNILLPKSTPTILYLSNTQHV